MTILDGHFECVHPLFNRRYEFFTHKFPLGKKASEWKTELSDIAFNCRLEEFTVDEIFLFRWFQDCPDQELLKEMRKIPAPITRKKIPFA
ncbi:Hypothetical protein FKW44_000823 [Caligus rogercresseyi]|uniref:Uncharacterized protein n=1 Tax=Caligus rogercresseyi TaxID=217165 RepID=A0A7T8KI04_CALRO|nr:Hypothetical protein FKW44_000823 [Caligus rogercresseyi]